MRKKEDVIFLQNVIEANLLASLLTEKGIPHYIKEYRDPVYKGSWHFVDAWGHVECPAEVKEKIKGVLADIRQGTEPG
jgi:hypothetical protein